ncbi:hypothetical protein U5801_01900 [Lamprobacter modestohalophilus]|uniref:hypothetical protein n=1 Tax=Lamprobacter modestohalophilus TaxID=1064514 RepID=UPI002ADED54F|nr:hypothetical protein [Lamprobacter modestohalophilus]MEA1048577.1 hypothetical protein [Lamprobacter modestohalophilus]
MSDKDEAADDPTGDLSPSWDQPDSTFDIWRSSLDDSASEMRRILDSPDLFPARVDREDAPNYEGIEKAIRAEQADRSRQLAKAIAEELRSDRDQNNRTRASTTREDRLSLAILAAIKSLRGRLGREPKADEVFRYLEDDPTGVVVDSTDDVLTWESENGALHDTKRKTLANRISRLRKAT